MSEAYVVAGRPTITAPEEPFKGKTYTRTLEVGKWKVGLGTDCSGWGVVNVSLKGLRNRAWPLIGMNKTEFEQLAGKVRDPEIPSAAYQTATHLRGTPSRWCQDGNVVCLWPCPTHKWTIEISLVDNRKPKE